MSKPILWLKRTYITMRNALDDELSDYNLTTSQLEILGYLYQFDGMEQKQLQHCSGIRSATLTGLLDKLERRGYVVRQSSTEDGRAKIVRLTDEAKQVFGELMNVMHDVEERMMQGFSSAEQAVLVDWMQRIATNLGDTGRGDCE